MRGRHEPPPHGSQQQPAAPDRATRDSSRLARASMRASSGGETGVPTRLSAAKVRRIEKIDAIGTFCLRPVAGSTCSQAGTLLDHSMGHRDNAVDLRPASRDSRMPAEKTLAIVVRLIEFSETSVVA